MKTTKLSYPISFFEALGSSYLKSVLKCLCFGRINEILRSISPNVNCFKCDSFV